jgi:hypothetical protein
MGPLESFCKLLQEKYEAIAQEDQNFVNSSIMEASADVFETIEAHLLRIHDQLLLFCKRLIKLYELKNLESSIRSLDMGSIHKLVIVI